MAEDGNAHYISEQEIVECPGEPKLSPSLLTKVSCLSLLVCVDETMGVPITKELIMHSHYFVEGQIETNLLHVMGKHNVPAAYITVDKLHK